MVEHNYYGVYVIIRSIVTLNFEYKKRHYTLQCLFEKSNIYIYIYIFKIQPKNHPSPTPPKLRSQCNSAYFLIITSKSKHSVLRNDFFFFFFFFLCNTLLMKNIKSTLFEYFLSVNNHQKSLSNWPIVIASIKKRKRENCVIVKLDLVAR